MSRMLSLLAAAIFLIAAFLIYRSIKESYGSPKSSPLEQHALVQDVLPEFEKWREFTPAEGHFRVLLPSLPQHVKDKFADPLTQEPRKYDAFVTTEEGKPVFMISAITFPRELKKNKETDLTLKAIVDQILSKNGKNELKSISTGSFRSFPSIDFSIINGDAVIAGKAFAYRNTLYIITLGNEKKLFNQRELDFFINSFQIIDDGAGIKTNE